MVKKNWFTWAREENEKTYTDYCEHKDRIIMSLNWPENPTGKFMVTCMSCEVKALWNGKDYKQKLPKVKWSL